MATGRSRLSWRVHGGPHGFVTETFGMGSLWAENGFAWLSVNFRGSTTFGRDFLRKIWGDAGHWELEDMVAARDFWWGRGSPVPTKYWSPAAPTAAI